MRPSDGMMDPLLNQLEVNKLESLAAVRQSEIRTLRALYRSEIEEAGQVSVVRQAFVFDGAERFRIEALPLQGALTLSLLTVDKDSARLLMPPEKKAIIDSDAAATLRYLLKVPLNDSDLMPLITARLPARMTRYLDCISSECYSSRGGAASVELVSKDGLFRIVIDSSNGLLQSLSVFSAANQEPLLHITYSEVMQHDGAMLPHRISFQVPEQSYTLSLELSKVVLNTTIPAKLFEQAIPNDYEIVDRRKLRGGRIGM